MWLEKIVVFISWS